MQADCIFCIDATTQSSGGIESARVLHGYEYWWLVVQREDKLKSTKQAAGLLIPHRHFTNVTDMNDDEAIELKSIIKNASARLCHHVGVVYSRQETVGFNQGPEAGQTVMHAHVHILPVAESDPAELKVRAGIGGAFEALREARLGAK